MTRLAARSSRRFLLGHAWQLALALAGLAGGVAVVVGVDLANDSALRALTRSSELVAGRATHRLVGIAGNLPETVYTRLRTRLGIRDAAPVLEATARLAGVPVTVLGIDTLGESPLHTSAQPDRDRHASFRRLMTEPRTIVLPRALAGRLALGPGDSATLEVRGRRVEVEVVGLVTPEAADLVDAAGLVLTDIATAQELLRLPGELSRIDLILNEHEAAALARADLGAVELVSAEARNRALVEMTRAFRVNLTALSLLALLVGAFLIHNTVAFLGLRRRRLFGLLRALGVSRRQLFRLVLGEGLVIGLAGSLAGLLLGALLASGLVQLVARTIGDLYAGVGDVPLRIGIVALAKGLALGVGVSMLAAWLPAREAAAAQPRAALSRASMEARARARQPALLALAGVFALLGAAIVFFPGRGLPAAFFGLFCIIAAAALVAPVVTVMLLNGVARLSERIPGRAAGLGGRFAARSAIAGLSRTGPAVSALAVAVAAVIGIGLMITSFRASVVGWLEASVSADFYVSAGQGGDAALDDVLAERIAALPGVRGVSRTRRAKLPLAAGVLHVWGIDPGTTGWRPRLLQGDTVTAWRQLEAGEAVLVSESFAGRHGTRIGDLLRLSGRREAREWPVAGVFVDYTTDQGLVAMSLGAYRRQFGDKTLSGIGVFLEPGSVPQSVRDGIANLVGTGRAGLRVASNREIRSASLEIFERTFRITGVLRLLAGLVALLGIYSALQSLALERRREMAVLRAIGFAPAQVSRHVMAQTALLGLTAAAVALPLSIALAWILVHVINERAFGWSMDLELSAPVLWQGIALALGAALLAGLWPALTLARGQPAAALREE